MLPLKLRLSEPQQRHQPDFTHAILFDFGGTLDADGVHWSTRFYAHYQRAGIVVERGTFDQAFVAADQAIAQRKAMENMTMHELLQLQVDLQWRFLGMAASPQAAAIVQSCYDETKTTLARNADILSRLAPIYQLGVVSNFSGNLARVCEEFGLTHFFAVILDSKIVGISKPDLRLFLRALDKMKRAPQDCYFVGDSFERDIFPAKFLGMRTVWMRGAQDRPCPDPTKVDFTIAALTELPAVLEGHV
jgi:HAD superfamily hydrolase (TIGR01549 family)